MSFRSLREQRLLSQEKLAEMSGLSLRTIQRLEAGHRVSYASLRALAITFEMDVDLLERELYAMKSAPEDFVEIPRWVRRMSDGLFWRGSPPVSRRQALIAEAICMGLGVAFLVASFFVSAAFMATTLRVGASFCLLSGYGLSINIRVIDSYKAWPTTETPWADWWRWRPVRTIRGTVMDYTFVVSVLILFFGAVFWLAG